MARPLSGLRVIDLSLLLPGPFATLLLADLGAEIIKVEPPPAGDPARYYPPLGRRMSAAYAALNRDKQSVCLDLKKPEGREALERLVDTADVLIEGFRPGVLARLGLSAELLRARNPRLIYCAITGYGQTGPLAERAGHDLNYLALSGLLAASGRDGEVVQPGFQAADLAGGALYAVIGVLAALHERTRTGEGQVVDVSMVDGVAGLGIMMQAARALDAQPTLAGGDDLAGARVCYRPYRCADGGYLAVGALEPKFWAGLCAAIGRPDLAADGMAVGARAEQVSAELAAVFATRPRDAWVRLFAEHDVCVEPVLSLAEARRSPQALARGWTRAAEHPVEGIELLNVYPNASLLPAHPPAETARPAAALGADTRAVLQDVGLSEEEIDALLASRAARAGRG